MSVKKLTNSDKQEILNLYRTTEDTTSTLATRYGVSNSTISRFLKTSLPELEYEALIATKRSSRHHTSETVAVPPLMSLGLGDIAVEAAPKIETVAEPPISLPEPTLATVVEPPMSLPEPVFAEVEREPSPPILGEAKGELEGSQQSASNEGRRRRRRSSAGTELALVQDLEPESVPKVVVEAELALVQDLEPELVPKVVEVARERTEMPQKRLPDISPSDRLPQVVGEKPLEMPQKRDRLPQATDLEDKLIEELEDELADDLDDSDLEDDEDDDWDDSDYPQEDEGELEILLSHSDSNVQVLPLSEASLPRTCYLVVDRAAELIARPLKDFGDLGQIPVEEIQEKTLPIFDNHRVARRYSNRTQRVIKVPDGRMFQKTRSQLQAKGITRLLIDGQVYSLST